MRPSSSPPFRGSGNIKPNIRWLLGCAVGVVLLVGAQANNGVKPFVDPLSLAPLQSSLVSKTQLVCVAQAGNRLVAVGWRGHIVYSEDQGRTWRQAQVPVSVDLTAVTFASATAGWAVGHGGIILRTSDGGLSWSKQQDGFSTGKLMADYYQQRLDQAAEADKPAADSLVEQVRQNYETGPEQPWLDVWFENEQHGYVVGTFNLIMETHDGGEHWTPLLDRVDNPEGLHLSAMNAVDGELYIASERGTVFRLDKTSQRFVALNSGYVGSFFGVTGNAQTLLAYGLRGNVWRSADKGATWSKVDTGIVNTLTGATVLADQRIALVSQGGALLIGDSAGEHFKPSTLSQNLPFASVVEAGKGAVVIVGTQGAQRESVPAFGG
ncbi:putative photosystem II stability/assembly factor-like protein [Pseudomonas sp. GM21]|uniref:WD40/YVTN/BNR-like repeat-containing protein n=1 Tax=Pseudomonas sp. GM21 TaxID=1144325 RepID=UPI0002725EB4|nr:YCF48-related protein [Pseudomonas sp. GM21]EJM24364.1 putative photosystem II stability/assembly factor-like protein [Pseudomonas sp. GM21]